MSHFFRGVPLPANHGEEANRRPDEIAQNRCLIVICMFIIDTILQILLRGQEVKQERPIPPHLNIGFLMESRHEIFDEPNLSSHHHIFTSKLRQISSNRRTFPSFAGGFLSEIV